MKNKLFLFSFILISFTSLAQKPFSGELNYKGTMNYPDTNLVYKSWDVKLFTNDTIVRVETQTDALGTQVYIRNMSVGKAYLLIEMDGQKFAIQTDLNKKKAADTTKIVYKYEKKLFGGKKINGIKCKKYHIIYSEKIQFDCYFAKNISNKYLEVYENIPGLAIDYYIPNEDGLIHYQLTKIEEKKVERNLFGIPSDFKRVSFEEFMKSMGLSE